MALRFLAIDPDTQGGHCPAMFLDEQTGDVLFIGWTETDPATLADAAQYSPVAPNETLVRIPARMRAIILEALNDAGEAT